MSSTNPVPRMTAISPLFSSSGQASQPAKSSETRDNEPPEWLVDALRVANLAVSAGGGLMNRDPLAGALQAVGHLRQGPLSGHATLADVVKDVRQGKPVGVRIDWSSGAHHFVAIYGCSEGSSGTEYAVLDPIFGRIRTSAWSLAHAYLSDGAWSHYYLTN